MLPDLDDQTDHRQWTQQHLDAADLRVSAMAPTPPQGEADADCMDVNVRGPGECPRPGSLSGRSLHFPGRSPPASSPEPWGHTLKVEGAGHSVLPGRSWLTPSPLCPGKRLLLSPKGFL